MYSAGNILPTVLMEEASHGKLQNSPILRKLTLDPWFIYEYTEQS